MNTFLKGIALFLRGFFGIFIMSLRDRNFAKILLAAKLAEFKANMLCYISLFLNKKKFQKRFASEISSYTKNINSMARRLFPRQCY